MGKKKRFPSKQQTPKRGEGCRFLKMIKMVMRMMKKTIMLTWMSAIMIMMLMTTRKRREPLHRSWAPELANSACSPRGRREGRFY